MSPGITAVLLLQILTLCKAQGTELVPESLTPLELWNSATWFYPFGIAASDAWSDYLKNAQRASNQLYKQVESAISAASILNLFGGVTKPPQTQGSTEGSTTVPPSIPPSKSPEISANSSVSRPET